MSKRAIICARVSTTAQAEKGHSIPSQFEPMRQYAKREGLTVIAEVQDDISGAIPIRQRPGGRALYEHIDGKTAEAVVFFTVDRITRDEDLIEINVIRRDVRNAWRWRNRTSKNAPTKPARGGVFSSRNPCGQVPAL